MPDVIVTIPGATNVTVDDAPATSVVVIFPASNYVVTTVIDRGILFGVEGPQGSTGGVNTINGQSGNVTLDTSEIPENPSALYFTNTRVYTKVKAALVAGSNVSFTYNDSLQTITIAASGNVLSVNGQTGAVVLDTDDVNEGTSNLYFTATRVRDAVLTGLSTATNAIISATDSVLSAFGKLQAQITANLSTLSAHIADTSNPHSVTKAQVGLGNVANVDTTNASNISSGTLSDSRLSANVTTQGNTFNTANKLVQLDASAKLPAVDGSQLTNLPITSTPTLAQVTTAGNTTTNSITVGGLIVDTNTLVVDSVNNRVGIGTATPSSLLEVIGNYAGSLDASIPQLKFQNSNTTSSVNLSAIARVLVGTGYLGGFPEIWIEAIRDSSNNGTTRIRTVSNHPLIFWTNNTERLRIFANGNVGIGTTTDAGYKLDVNGTARVQNVLRLGRLTADPATADNGDIYYNTTTNKFRGYENGAWTNLI